MPSGLSEEGKREWRRITSELEAMGILAKVDRAALTLYVQAWQRGQEGEVDLATKGVVIPAPRTGVPMQNPWLSIVNKCHEQTAKLLTEFGMTPSSRTRMKMEQEEAVDLSALIGGA